FQKFVTPNNATRFDVKILQNPMQMLEECYARFLNDIQMPVPEAQGLKSIVLPLYSSKSGNVEPKSGLNQWNADDEKRRRKPNEMYIPVPVWIHHQFPDFFPPIDISFNLKLPNQRTIIAKMCQTQIVKINGHEINKGKSLMSNPNSDLGKWILRDILNVPENQIVTKNDLDRIGIDSVEIEKIDDNNYDINFKQTGEFERFKARNE
ncbi:MAG TPA: NgoFVII family restriction endonuclease, partial [Candidatus Cloacimonadota bacterium]|nr:NgoFVII family restriction endonuclease [Candidatus Cloacimonadota bacterium]